MERLLLGAQQQLELRGLGEDPAGGTAAAGAQGPGPISQFFTYWRIGVSSRKGCDSGFTDTYPVLGLNAPDKKQQDINQS
ncbi:hypothetical protein E5288_WYG005681 [Bos mutus]|uniref:Uncharacterized protein n=1 Tax=Bos mutus TaxID=72004 RepID=A0A6B0RSI9_9CETA|nr:hypothetical protein [Bos mutus]